jgi:histidinol-phosphate aminotransferase
MPSTSRSSQLTSRADASEHPSSTAEEFGAQGGDPTRGVTIDLSTCVNRYGPAPFAVAALHAIEPQDILLHPYDAAVRLKSVYHWATGVAVDDLVAGRGASEFIWAMGREVDHGTAAIPLPGYTDYLKAFPGRGFQPERRAVPVARAGRRRSAPVLSSSSRILTTRPTRCSIVTA